MRHSAAAVEVPLSRVVIQYQMKVLRLEPEAVLAEGGVLKNSGGIQPAAWTNRHKRQQRLFGILKPDLSRSPVNPRGMKKLVLPRLNLMHGDAVSRPSSWFGAMALMDSTSNERPAGEVLLNTNSR
jgi:hypothetical protein